MKRFVVSSTLVAALASIVLAATAQAWPAPPDGGTLLVKNDGTSPAQTSTSDASQAEQTGTATTDGVTITVTGADGTSITCAVPAGLDVTPFLTGEVKAECDFVDGVLTVTELKGSDGASVEVEDDGTVVVQAGDDAEDETGDETDDDGGQVTSSSGPGSTNSGPGSATRGEDGGDDSGGGSGADQGGGDDGGGGVHGGGGGDD